MSLVHGEKHLHRHSLAKNCSAELSVTLMYLQSNPPWHSMRVQQVPLM